MDIESLNQIVTKELELPYNRYKHNDDIDTLANIKRNITTKLNLKRINK